jgi:hypothetical protein
MPTPATARTAAPGTVATAADERHRPEQARCELKTPYKDGTTHIVFEPLDFLSRLGRAQGHRASLSGLVRETRLD